MNTKSLSDAKISANRTNAKKSAGPNNTFSTRLNATKHGLLSSGITELDDANGYRDTLHRLSEAYLEEVRAFLVERIALYMTRLRRGSRLEAEFITSVLNPPIHGPGTLPDLSDFTGPLLDPGLPVSISSGCVKSLVDTYTRYETANENKLYRAMNQLERVQRIRLGEQLPAPAALDIGVHSDGLGLPVAGAAPKVASEGPQEFAPADSEACTQNATANDTNEQHSSKAGS